MELVDFPKPLRDAIAALELDAERGMVLDLEGERAELIRNAMAARRPPLLESDGWRFDATPPQEHNPKGLIAVWWREGRDLTAELAAKVETLTAENAALKIDIAAAQAIGVAGVKG